MKPVIVAISAFISLLGICYAVIFCMVRSGIEEPMLEFRWGPFPSSVVIVSDEVPLQEKIMYGWVCHFRSAQAEPVWSELLTMPFAPKTWETSMPIGSAWGWDEPLKMSIPPKAWRSSRLMSISEDRKTAHCSGVAEWDSWPSSFLDRICFVKRYTAYHYWEVAEGDPAGEYVFRVSLEGKVTTKVLRLHPVPSSPAGPTPAGQP